MNGEDSIDDVPWSRTTKNVNDVCWEIRLFWNITSKKPSTSKPKSQVQYHFLLKETESGENTDFIRESSPSWSEWVWLRLVDFGEFLLRLTGYINIQ